MDFKLCFVALIVLIGVFNVNASSPAALYIRQRAEDALHEQMIKSRSAPMFRSGISTCHPYYSELLQSLLETYENDVQKCEAKEAEQLVSLTNEGQQSRDATTSTLDEICASVEGCKANSENLDFFDCVNESGDKNTKNVWKASKDSSDVAAHIREQIHEIKYQTGRCTSEAERQYIVGTAKATDDMMACYASGGVIPTPTTTVAPATDAPSTEATSTVEPSTEAPATDAPSTEAPATDAPSTVEPSTEAPSTEAPATDAPSTETPATDAPSTEAPATDAPSTVEPSTEAPATDAPSTVEPSTEAPSTEAPATEAPSTVEPSTDAPLTEAPATDAPLTEAPSTTEEISTTATDSTSTSVSPPESDERDQVEELEENMTRTRLENFMKNWGKRS